MRATIDSAGLAQAEVIHITLANQSGSALYVAELASAQARAGARATAVVPRDFEYMHLLRGAGVEVIELPISGDRQPKFSAALARVIRGTRFIVKIIGDLKGRAGNSVLHFNFVSPGLCQLIVSIQARLKGFSSVITLHDALPNNSTTAPFRAAFDVISHWIAFRFTKWVHVHTPAQASAVTRIYAINVRNCIVLPHGVTVPETPRRSEERDVTTFALVGAIRRNKGIREVIEAFREIAVGNKKLRLVIAGRVAPTERGYWRDCLQLIAKSAAEIAVIERYLSEAEFVGFLSSADCVLLPYSSFVAQSGVVLRAASLGIPTIASPAVVINDVSLSTVCGELQLANVSQNEIARGMRAFLALPHPRRMEIAVQLKGLCSSKFGWDAVAPGFVAMYSRVHGDYASADSERPRKTR